MMEIAARYYLANPPYFKDLATKALEDDTFILPSGFIRRWSKTSLQRRLSATLADPRYSVGSLVACGLLRLRICFILLAPSLRESKTRTGKLATVIKTDAKPVTSPARGVRFIPYFSSGRLRRSRSRSDGLRRVSDKGG